MYHVSIRYLNPGIHRDVSAPESARCSDDPRPRSRRGLGFLAEHGWKMVGNPWNLGTIIFSDCSFGWIIIG